MTFDSFVVVYFTTCKQDRISLYFVHRSVGIRAVESQCRITADRDLNQKFILAVKTYML
jgi:hypothetical protein